MKYPCLVFIISIVNLVYSKDYIIPEIPESLLENANSILLEEKIDVEITSHKEYLYNQSSVKLIRNKNGNSHTQVYVPYDNSVKVKSIEAIIFDKDGNEIEKFKKKDFLDISAVDNGSLYSDDRLLVINYTPTSYPYVVSFKYSLLYEETAFIRPFAPVPTYKSSVLKSQYNILVNPSLGLKQKTYDPLGVFRVDKNANGYSFKLENFEALLPEAHSVSFSSIEPKVLFGIDKFQLRGVTGNSRNWKEFGKWYYDNMLIETSNISEDTKHKIQQLVANETTVIDRAKKVYEYMQQKTRYISVQIGIGGWKPMLASEVDELGYGDCKALTNYTRSLFDAAGVPSYYTILYSGQEKRDVLSDFPTMQGNHAILAVPVEDDYIWLECTNQNIPFGYLGSSTDDRDVLVVTPDGGEIAHTKSYDSNNNKLLTTGKVSVKENGSIEVDVELKASGIQYGYRYSIAQKTSKEQKEFYKEYWDYIDNLELQNVDIINNKEDVVFTEKIKFRADSYTSNSGTNLILNLNTLNRNTYIPKRYQNRKLPLQIPRGYIDEDQVIIDLPDGYQVESMPEDTLIESPYGTYSTSLSRVNDNSLLYKRSLNIKEGQFPREEYNAYRKFRRAVAKNDNQKILIIKN